MKRMALIITVIAIMMVVSTTTANCQAASAVKALVKVVEKGAKGVKPPKVPRLDIGKQIGINNTTYTKIGYAVKSLYDDNDYDNKQQRAQVTNLKNDLQKAQQEAEEISAIISKFCEDLTADLPTKNRKEICNKNDCTGYHYGYENYNMQFNNPCNKFYFSFNNNIKPLARLTLNEQSPKTYNSITSISENSWKNLRLTKNIKHNYINY